MRAVKILGAAFLAVLALSAFLAAAASAALPEFEPGKEKTTFTIAGGAGELAVEGQIPVACKATEGSGEIVGTTKKLAVSTLTFTGCTALGFIGAHSLGDPEGTIKTKVHLLLCYIKKGSPLEVGVLTKILSADPEDKVEEVHIEVAGKLLMVKGDQVGKITPLKTATTKFTIEFKQKGALPIPTGCEGQTEEYEAQINEGPAVMAAKSGTVTVTFAVAQIILE